MKNKKKTNGLKQRIKEAMVHIFGGIIMYEPTREQDDLEQPYLFNFTNGYRGGWGTNPNGLAPVNGDNNRTAFIIDSQPEKVIISVKPIDVIHELETVPTPFSVENIDEKIVILKDKADLIQQKFAHQEVKALIQRMEHRKQYAANRVFFEQFQNTTDEKINDLLKKYPTLRLKISDIFIPEFPDEAVKIMKKYKEKVKKITGKDPVFMVIAPDEQFKKVNEKRDPILLVQSPFGFYWQILGVWDQEMLVLSEL